MNTVKRYLKCNIIKYAATYMKIGFGGWWVFSVYVLTTHAYPYVRENAREWLAQTGIYRSILANNWVISTRLYSSRPLNNHSGIAICTHWAYIYIYIISSKTFLKKCPEIDPRLTQIDHRLTEHMIKEIFKIQGDHNAGLSKFGTDHKKHCKNIIQRSGHSWDIVWTVVMFLLHWHQPQESLRNLWLPKNLQKIMRYFIFDCPSGVNFGTV